MCQGRRAVWAELKAGGCGGRARAGTELGKAGGGDKEEGSGDADGGKDSHPRKQW